MWSVAMLDPALPGCSIIAVISPDPSGAQSMNVHNGWNTNPIYHVGFACSFSKCAVISIASKSITTGASTHTVIGRVLPGQQRPRRCSRVLPGRANRGKYPFVVLRQRLDRPRHGQIRRDPPGEVYAQRSPTDWKQPGAVTGSAVDRSQ